MCGDAGSRREHTGGGVLPAGISLGLIEVIAAYFLLVLIEAET